MNIFARQKRALFSFFLSILSDHWITRTLFLCHIHIPFVEKYEWSAPDAPVNAEADTEVSFKTPWAAPYCARRRGVRRGHCGQPAGGGGDIIQSSGRR